MAEKTASELIKELMTEKLGWKPHGTVLGGNRDPFDISQPNIHENKSDFLYEMDAVSTVVKNSSEIIDKIFVKAEIETNQHREMVDRLIPAIESQAIKIVQNDPPSSAFDLVQKNMLENEFYWHSLVTVFQMGNAYNERLRELRDQEMEFWSVNHRPPNYYARAIALRFARFYARQTSKKPTFGTSRDGPHPSTDYAKLLEEIFSILEIKSGLRNPAIYAIERITPEDIKPETSSLSQLGKLFGMGETKPDKGIHLSMATKLEEPDK